MRGVSRNEPANFISQKTQVCRFQVAGENIQKHFIRRLLKYFTNRKISHVKAMLTFFVISFLGLQVKRECPIVGVLFKQATLQRSNAYSEDLREIENSEQFFFFFFLSLICGISQLFLILKRSISECIDRSVLVFFRKSECIVVIGVVQNVWRAKNFRFGGISKNNGKRRKLSEQIDCFMIAITTMYHCYAFYNKVATFNDSEKFKFFFKKTRHFFQKEFVRI